MILIDGFVLSKCNGMSYCLISILSSISIGERGRYLVLVPSVEAKNRIPDGFTIKLIKAPWFVLWENLLLPFYIALNSSRISSVFFPANTSPFLLFTGVRRFLLLHDIMFCKDLPCGSIKQRMNHLYYKWNVQLLAKRMDHIFTVSNYSKQDIIASIKSVSPERITVIDESVKSFPTSEPIDGFYFSHSFVLGVCLSDPRKNSSILIDGFLMYKRNNPYSTKKLVLFGDYLSWDKLRKVHNLCSKSDGDVVFVGRVSDAQLAFLYENCHCFVFPSVYEGFGLPVLEAMSFGKPVITTNKTSLPEVGGVAAYYISDVTPNAICSSLVHFDNPEVYKHYCGLSLDNVMRYSWSRSAELISCQLKGEGNN